MSASILSNQATVIPPSLSPVDFEQKYDSDGFQTVTHVKRKRSRASTPPPPRRTPAAKKVWRETQASKLKRLEAVAENKRREAMSYSLHYGGAWDAANPLASQLSDYESEPEVTVPSETAPKKRFVARRTAKSARRSWRKKAAASTENLPAPLPAVSKEEAAAPVPRPNTPLLESDSDFHSEVDAIVASHPVGEISVRDPKVRSTKQVHRNAGRLVTSKTKKYRIVQSSFVGVARKYLSEDDLAPIAGFLMNTDESFEVELPSTCVAEFGSWWVNNPPSTAIYKQYSHFVDRWCLQVDMTPEMEFDVKVYGAYLGFITRHNERSDMIRRVRGGVYTRAAQACAMIGTLFAGVSSIPVAAAATTVAQVSPITSICAGAAAATIGTVITALAVRAALPWFSHDLLDVQPSRCVPSFTAVAEPPKQKEDATLKVVDNPKQPDVTRPDAAVPTGVSVPGYEPLVFAPNQDNMVAALKKRAFAESAPGDRKDFIAWTRKYWPDIIGKVFDLHVPVDVSDQDELVEEWLKGSGSSPSVKARIRNAWAEMRADGFDMHTNVSSSLAIEWTKRDASVKVETLLKDESAMPRQIMAAPPQFVAVIAPFVKMLTGYIRRRLSSGCLIYAPGMAEEKLSELVSEREWDNRANGDFNAYDANQGPDMGEEEIALFTRYGLPVLGRQLMRANLKVHGGSRTGVKFTAPYCRMSGDPHTTLMNTVWNLVAMSYVYCSERGIHPRHMDVLFLAGGDDSQINYNGPPIDFEARLAAIGLPATVKHVEHLNRVEFLSSRLTRTSRGWRFLPMVGKMAAKLAFSVHATSETAPGVCRGSALSMVSAASASPPMLALLNCFLRITQGAKEIGPRDEPWKMSLSSTGQATSETWDDLREQYGWNQGLQDQLEEDLSQVKVHGMAINSGPLRILMDMDSSRKYTTYEKDPDSDSATDLFYTADEKSEYEWSESKEDRNRAQHASNGNIVRSPHPNAQRFQQTPTSVETPDRIYVAADHLVNASDLGLESRFSFTKAAARHAALRVDVPRVDPDIDSDVEDEDSDRGMEEGFSRGCVEMFAKIAAQKASRYLADLFGLEDDGYVWSISAKARNRAQHAANGNRNGRTNNRRQNRPSNRAAARPSMSRARNSRDTPPRPARAVARRSDGSSTGTPVAISYATDATSTQPRVTSGSNRTRIQHRELVAPITGSVGFSAIQIAVNPGIPGSFNWLSTQAGGWEKYRFRSLRYRYLGRAPSTTQGSVLMAMDYDSADPMPTTENQTSTWHGTQETAVWKDLTFTANQGMIGRECFVRTGAIPANNDIKLYDVGNFFMCATDATSASPIGKLWVEYDIEFINQQVGANSLGASTLSGITGMASSVPLGTSQTATGPIGLSTANGYLINITGLIVGTEYLISLWLGGTGFSTCTLSAPVNLTQSTNLIASGLAGMTAATAAGTYVATAASAQISIGDSATSIASSHLVVTQVSLAAPF